MVYLALNLSVLAFVLSALAALSWRWRRFSPSSPVSVVAVLYVSIGVVGYLFYKYSDSYQGGFYDLGLRAKDLELALSTYIGVAITFLLGAGCYSCLPRKRAEPVIQGSSSEKQRDSFGAVGASSRSRWWALIMAAIPLGFILIGFGPEEMWHRDTRFSNELHYVLLAGDLLSMPAVLVLGYTVARDRGIFVRGFSCGLFVAYILIELSLSSRGIVVIFMFFIAGLALGGAKGRSLSGIALTWIVLLPLLTEIPLELRGMPAQGLYPLMPNIIEALSGGVEEIYRQGSERILANLTYGVPLSIYVAGSQEIPQAILLVGLNPLPSFIQVPGLPSWHDVSHLVRVNPIIPYSAIGELMNHGVIWLVGYFFVVGFTSCWIDRQLSKALVGVERWGFMLSSGLLFFMAISSTQYTLRATTRFYYYAVFIALCSRAISKLYNSGKKRRENGGDYLVSKVAPERRY